MRAFDLSFAGDSGSGLAFGEDEAATTTESPAGANIALNVTDGSGKGLRSIQMCTALIIHFIQCVPALPLEERYATSSTLIDGAHNSSGSAGAPPNDDMLKHLQQTIDGEGKLEVRKTNCQTFVDTVVKHHEEAKKLSRHFAAALLKSQCLDASITVPANASVIIKPVKERVISILQDLLSVVNLPEWPAAELILTSFAQCCAALCNPSGTISSAASLHASSLRTDCTCRF